MTPGGPENREMNAVGIHRGYMPGAIRGQGAERRLLDAAVDFCRGNGYPGIRLRTFAGLHAARHLYEQAGFARVEERRGAQWGTEVTEQRFELAFGPISPDGRDPS